MMEWVRRQEIDDVRWNNLIVKYGDGQPYGLTAYLDTLTDKKWDALIDRDYNWVIPLPFNRKLFGFKQIYRPVFFQQGGPYGVFPNDISWLNEVCSKIKKHSVRASFGLSEYVSEEIKSKGIRRANYVLDLDKTYSELRKAYSKSALSNIKQASAKRILVTQTDDWSVFEAGYIKHVLPKIQQGTKLNNKYIKKYIDGIKSMSKCYLSTDENGTVSAGAVVIESTQRLVNTMLFTDRDYPQKGSASLIFDHIIQKYANRALLLDFEGSEIPGVAYFNESLGALKREYVVFNL